MELQTTGDHNGIANRDTVAKFVHDLADMEVRAFTLKESAKRIREELQWKQVDLEKTYQQKQSDRECKNRAYSDSQNKVSRTRFGKGYFSVGLFFATLFLWYIVTAFICAVLTSLLSLLTKNTTVLVCFGVVLGIICTVAFIAYFIQDMKSAYYHEKNSSNKIVMLEKCCLINATRN